MEKFTLIIVKSKINVCSSNNEIFLITIFNITISDLVPIVVVGNKMDLAVGRGRQVRMSEVFNLKCSKMPMYTFFETSAKKYSDVHKVFLKCLQSIDEIEVLKEEDLHNNKTKSREKIKIDPNLNFG